MLLWMLLPGLLLARQRLPSLRALGRDDLSAEMLAGVWTEATRISSRDRRVAARLLNSARWRAIAAIREAAVWAGRTEPLAYELAEQSNPTDQYPLGTEPDGLIMAVREGVLSTEEAELVLAGRRTIRRISEKLGIRLGTAQLRRHRARARLRAWIEES